MRSRHKTPGPSEWHAFDKRAFKIVDPSVRIPTATDWVQYDHPDDHPFLKSTALPQQAGAKRQIMAATSDTEEDEPKKAPAKKVAAPPEPEDDVEDLVDEEDEMRRLQGLPALPPPAAVPSGTATDGSGGPDDPLGPLADGASTSVAGSGVNTYTIKRTGDSYHCSCPAWKNQGGTVGTMRTCKHIKALRGAEQELARLGGDNKAFFASGNRVAGAAVPSGGSSSADPSGGTGGGSDVSLDIAKQVALANAWDGTAELDGWALSEKLDGQRCVWDGVGKLWTRTGHEMFPPPSLLAALPRGCMLDGECWLGRGRFQRLMTISRRTDGHTAAAAIAWAPVEFVVFDAPKAPGGIFERLEAAKAALAAMPPPPAAAAVDPGAPPPPPAPRVRVLEHEQCSGAAHIRSRLAEVVALGGEGLVARHPTAPHKPGRSPDLLKVKEQKDDEAIVTGHEPGKGKHAGRMGALVCRLRSGKTFKVGTGFTDREREDPPPVGTVITFNYFELTLDSVPRFPSYSRIRPDVSASVFG